MKQIPEAENAELSGGNNISIDGSGPTSRSSVTHVAYIVSKFDNAKRELVREIGFEGILDLPQIAKVDRKFTLWLLTKVDPEKRCIIVNAQRVADVIDFEVARIMGIPCGMRAVCSLDPGDKKSKKQFIQQFIGCPDLDNNTLSAAENNVTAQYELPMTIKDKNSFKVSFVVWVMGHLLAPTKKHNVGGDQFWGALLVPDEIKQFNWAGYVTEELMMAARDVHDSLKLKKPVNAITGCSILLQILYFESINLGSLNRPRGISPRVKVYDAKALSSMIAADKASSSSGVGTTTWGSSVRRIPGEPDENLQPGTQGCLTGADTNIDPELDVINNFGSFVRENFGEKVSKSQSAALSWFHARCLQRCHQFRLSVQQDTISLIRKLFVTPDVGMPPTSAQLVHTNTKAPRPAQSEPSRPILHERIIDSNKRGADSLGTYPKRRGYKRHHVSSRQYELPETLLSGGSVPDDHELDDEISDTNHYARTVSHTTANDMDSSGFGIETPSFDLGLEVDTDDEVQHAVHDSENVTCRTPSVNNQAVCTQQMNVNPVSTPNKKLDGSSAHVGFSSALGHTPTSAKTLEPVMFSSPDQRIRSSTSPGTLSKILAEGDLVDRMTHFEDSPNINIKPWDHDYIDSPVIKRVVGFPNISKSPWMYQLYHRTPPIDIVDTFFNDVSVSNFSTLNRPWLAHTSPRHIELDGTWIHKSFIMGDGLSYDIFDLAIRRLKQLDDLMYSETAHTHWRHILESEFAMFAMAGEIPYNRKSIIEQFVGSSLRYRLEDCRMIVVPAFILLNWSSYFFDLENKCVHVIDPLYKKDQSDVFSKVHQPNISKVAASLANCFEMFFENWHHDMHNWRVFYVEPHIVDATSAETGLLTLMYIREFDGSRIHLGNRESFYNFKKHMLYELMCLAENPVKPPVKITITLDD